MATESFKCSVITPEAQVFEGDANEVVIPAHDGEIGILVDRAPLVCRLGSGRLRVVQGETEQIWFVDAGFAQVLNNRVVVLTQKAIKPAEIDAAAAQQMLDDARSMVATDHVAQRRKARMEASARAQLRLSRSQ